MEKTDTAAIRELMPQLSSQMAAAARYLLAHPEDVAVCSMRELARRCKVSPVALVRLAQRLGLPGYSGLRRRYVDKLLRAGSQAQLAGLTQLAATRNVDSARAIAEASQTTESLLDFAGVFFAAEQDLLRAAMEAMTHTSLKRATDLLAQAPKVFVIGRRTAFPPAYALSYALRKARSNVILLDDMGGAPESALEQASTGDALVAITFAPFSRITVNLAQRAALAGTSIIGISDSSASPTSKLAGDMFFVTPTLSRAFPESAGGALAVANLLSALTISKLGEQGQQRIKSNELHIANSGEYVQFRSRHSRPNNVGKRPSR